MHPDWVENAGHFVEIIIVIPILFRLIPYTRFVEIVIEKCLSFIPSAENGIL